MITPSAKKKQRNKKSGGRGWTKSEKGGGEGFFMKYGVIGTLCQLSKQAVPQ